MNKFIQILDYLYRMGISWTLFRIKYEIRRLSSYFDRANKRIINRINSIDYSKYSLPKLNINFCDTEIENFTPQKADLAIQGKIFSFSNEYLDYAENGKINWHFNPVIKKKSPNNVSWNQLSDFSEYGDIKLIWEVSRFPQIYQFILAYQKTKDKKYAKACLSQIEEWIISNPYPKGVNYKCGQEIAFRILDWTIAVDYFKDFVTSEFKDLFFKNIYTSLLRIDLNIDYAVKSVKNNHSISESIGLLLGGIFYSDFSESKYWEKKGLKILLQELQYQVYEDGSYLQHSFTYQRLVLDLLSFLILVLKKFNKEIPQQILDVHYKMIIFLNSFVQDNGYLPNYGSNDGANLFPLGVSDYRDFRPNLNFASAVLKGKILFNEGKELIDFFGLKYNTRLKINKKTRFDVGGYYILKNKNCFLFIRSHTYKHRPAHNDSLHIDIWYKGKNILCDAGTYSYNTDAKFKDCFTGVKGHNLVIVNDENYMNNTLNFGFSNWTKTKLIKHTNNIFEAENYAYKKKYNIIIRRKIKLFDNKIEVIDRIFKVKQEINLKQIWNSKFFDNNYFKITSNIPNNKKKSYFSEYYNSYEKIEQLCFETMIYNDFEIKTIIELL